MTGELPETQKAPMPILPLKGGRGHGDIISKKNITFLSKDRRDETRDGEGELLNKMVLMVDAGPCVSHHLKDYCYRREGHLQVHGVECLEECLLE